MTDFLALLADADAAIAEHLFTPGVLRPGRSDAVDPVPVAIERPTSVVAPVAGQAGFVRARPVVRMPVNTVAADGVTAVLVSVSKGDEVEAEGRLWLVVAAPTRPDDGRWWRAEVEDLGAVTG